MFAIETGSAVWGGLFNDTAIVRVVQSSRLINLFKYGGTLLRRRKSPRLRISHVDGVLQVIGPPEKCCQHNSRSMRAFLKAVDYLLTGTIEKKG